MSESLEAAAARLRGIRRLASSKRTLMHNCTFPSPAHCSDCQVVEARVALEGLEQHSDTAWDLLVGTEPGGGALGRLEKECRSHNVRGEDGPCDCDSCRLLADAAEKLGSVGT